MCPNALIPYPAHLPETCDHRVVQYRLALIPSSEKMGLLKADFIHQMEEGLSRRMPEDGKHVLMLPTYVTRLPDGFESGDCYAIDMGGTNFRVMYVRLSKQKCVVETMDMHEVALPQALMKGRGEELFDFLAVELKAFITSHAASSSGTSAAAAAPVPVVGFCFSFPAEQVSLTEGKLLGWSKGFTASGCVGNDPVDMLSQALQRAGMHVHIAALLNDTVGVLVAQRYLDPDTLIGVIIGTGSNACYVEDVGRVTKWAYQPGAGTAGSDPSTSTCINIEWGGFSSASLPRCGEDEAEDAEVHAGKHHFEKLVSGMFMGSVAGRILATVAGESAFFHPTFRAWLAKAGSLTTAHLAAIVDGEPVASVLAGSVGCSMTAREEETVQQVCRLVARRSATLVAVAIDGILTHNGWHARPVRATIAVDGGVYKKFRRYREMLGEAFADLQGDKAAELCPLLNFTLSTDGSGLGAAVLAAAAAK
ncbi:MAG: hypothetical protein WDW36_008143 [Sanguina aurantia]